MAYAWIKKNETIRIYDSYISKGLVYVGTGLYSANKTVADACLINPNLEVDKTCTDFTITMPYWPTYAAISPSQRNAYLTWLALGCPIGANIGFVFLRFYGLEHRSLYANITLDNEEQQTLIYEVVELLHKFGDNQSFRKYATSLLGLQASLFNKFELVLDLLEDIPELSSSSYEYPLYYKIILGYYLARRIPLPSKWAIAAVVAHPHLAPKRKLALSPEFKTTFEGELTSRHPNGFILSNLNQPPKIKLFYAPASSSLPEIGVTQELVNPAISAEFTTFLGNLLTKVNELLTEKNQAPSKLKKVLKQGGEVNWKPSIIYDILSKTPYVCKISELIMDLFGCQGPAYLTEPEWTNFKEALLIKGVELYALKPGDPVKIQKRTVILVTNKTKAAFTSLIPEYEIRYTLEKLVDTQIKEVTHSRWEDPEAEVIREFLEKAVIRKNVATACKLLNAIPYPAKLKNLAIVVQDAHLDLGDPAEIKKWVQLGHRLKVEDTDLYDIIHDTSRGNTRTSNIRGSPDNWDPLIKDTASVATLLDSLLNSDEIQRFGSNLDSPEDTVDYRKVKPLKNKLGGREIRGHWISQDLATALELLIRAPVTSIEAFANLLKGTKLMPEGAIEQINDITQNVFGDPLIDDIASFDLNPSVLQKLVQELSA